MAPPTEAADGAKRRLSAIMVADIVGYSRLVGIDEIGTLSAVRDIRERIVEPLLSQYDGCIVKLMGDGLLLEFGSAINAVKSAMEIQRGLAARNAATPVKSRIQFRIGIHVGDVVIDEQDILGDGVNIAARLEAIADLGGICLSAAVHDQVRDRLVCAFEDMGEQSLKNIARPLRVYRLLPDAEGSASRVEPVLAFTARPAIAVLPFDNLSGDPAETYFVDGLTDDIITSLSYWRWFPVIARNSTFSYKGKPKNATDIGRELNAAYLLEGSARRGGDRVRICPTHRCRQPGAISGPSDSIATWPMFSHSRKRSRNASSSPLSRSCIVPRSNALCVPGLNIWAPGISRSRRLRCRNE